MAVPITSTRRISLRMLMDLLRNSHRVYYPELRFAESVEMMMISHAIFLAEIDEHPFNMARLAKHLDIPRATLARRVRFLEVKGYVLRSGTGNRDRQHLVFNARVLRTAAAMRNARRAREIIAEAAAALSKLDNHQ